MINLRKMAATISVIGFMAAAPAASAGGGAVLLTNSGPLLYTGAFSQVYGAWTPAFTDDWTFTLPVGPFVSGQAGGTAIASFSPAGSLTSFITNSTFIDLTANTVLASGPGTVHGGIYDFVFSNFAALNPAHNYALRLFGGTLVTGGSYGGTLSVSVNPVPEPGTYAMMLAGLGLLGFMVRRRKTG